MSASSTLDNDAECNTTVSDGSTAACRGRCKTLFTARFGFCPVVRFYNYVRHNGNF